MKRVCAVLFILLLNHLAFCQSEKNWILTAKAGDGFIIAHRPSVVHVLQKHSRSFEVDYTFKTRERKGWEELYNFPELGIGYQYFNLGNPTELGSAHGVFGLVKFNLFPFKNGELKTHLGLGVGYVSRPFNTTDNYKNLLVGSHINATITTGIEYNRKLSDHIDFNAGINLTHYSNGASKVPNMGINLAVLNLGVNYYLQPIASIKKDSVSIEREKSIEILVAGGIKQIYPPNNPTYGVGIFTGDYLFPIRKKSILTLGGDIYIDGSSKFFLLSDSIIATGASSCLRSGVHLGYGLRAGKCSGILQTGYYFYNPYDLDGKIYSTLSFRYHINKHLFACFNLKSHYARADYFQYGFGYHF